MTEENNGEIRLLRLALREAERREEASRNELKRIRDGVSFIVREFKIACQGGTDIQEVICFLREKNQEIESLRATVARLEAEKEQLNAKRKHKAKA